MKIIKSISVTVVFLCTTTLLYAQQPKTEIEKPIEVKIPASAANRPSPQPQLQPQPQVAATPTEAPAAAAASSPLTRKEDAIPVEKEKPETKTFNKNDIATPGGEEGKKIMAGKTTRPTPEINNHSTIDPKPAPLVKPANTANGQQQ